MNQQMNPKDLLDAWWQFKKDQCPLCKKKLKISSITRHIKGNFCSSLLSLSPDRRLELSHYFIDLKSKFGGRKKIPHLQSQNEKVASAICGLLGFRYHPHLE